MIAAKAVELVFDGIIFQQTAVEENLAIMGAFEQLLCWFIFVFFDLLFLLEQKNVMKPISHALLATTGTKIQWDFPQIGKETLKIEIFVYFCLDL